MATERGAGGEGRRPRADARRNIEAILDAAEKCLARDPEATVAEIAGEAGVGRVTLYGHFPSRRELVDATFERVTERAHVTLDAIDTSGDPAAALRQLVASSWRVVHQFRAILAAAERDLPAERIRSHHDRHRQRLTLLLSRGRDAGVFRADVPLDWLATATTALMHAAAIEVLAGRLEESAAQAAVVETVLGACQGPAAAT